ncbi:MAG: calcium-binding protein [Methylococcales bacterium]
MNSNFICTGLCLLLSNLAFSNSGLASPEVQSVKLCPREFVSKSDVVLTREFPNARFNDHGTPINIGDDFYEVCKNDNFTDCRIVVPASETGVPGLTIIGGKGQNIVYGTPGDDVICGKGGKDMVDGREGDDIIYGNNGADHLSGGLGDDELYGGNGPDDLSGYDDDHDGLPSGDLNGDGIVDDLDTDQDLLEGGNGPDTLSGGPDDDSMYGENGNDEIYGGFGDDVLSGGNGPDVLNGGPGDDDIMGDNGNDDCNDPGDGNLDDDCSASDDEDDHGSDPSLFVYTKQ